MEDHDTKKSEKQSSKKLPPTSSNIQTDDKSRPTKKRKHESGKQEKWSLVRHWRAASRKQQFIWSLEVIGGLIAAGVLGVYIADHFQRERQFRVEQRPIISVLTYRIGDTNTHHYELNAGNPFFVEITYQNTGKSPALHIYTHRHVVFGNQYSQVRIEPADPDAHKSSDRLDPGAPPVVTDAVSVQDTYKVESIYVDPSSLRAWDGTFPIVAFGRFTYEDSFGTVYCTPFGASYLQAQTFNILSAFPPQAISVSDLCPTGTIQ